MAIGTKKAQIRQGIVVPVAINMVELKGYLRSQPSRQSALGAASGKDAFGNQSSPKITALVVRSPYKHSLQRLSRHHRNARTFAVTLPRPMARIKLKFFHGALHRHVVSAAYALPKLRSTSAIDRDNFTASEISQSRCTELSRFMVSSFMDD
jgi:hypothetical protein